MKNKLQKFIEFSLIGIGIISILIVCLFKTEQAFAQKQAFKMLDQECEKPCEVMPNQDLWSQGRKDDFYKLQRNGINMKPLASLEIPSIDLRVAVFDGTSDEVLNIGTGRVTGTANVGELGNLAIAGHRDSFFRGLKDIEIGSTINVNNQLVNNTYKVSEILIVDPSDTFVLLPTEEQSLTLITCYPFYFVGSAPERFIVKATLIK